MSSGHIHCLLSDQGKQVLYYFCIFPLSRDKSERGIEYVSFVQRRDNGDHTVLNGYVC